MTVDTLLGLIPQYYINAIAAVPLNSYFLYQSAKYHAIILYVSRCLWCINLGLLDMCASSLLWIDELMHTHTLECGHELGNCRVILLLPRSWYFQIIYRCLIDATQVGCQYSASWTEHQKTNDRHISSNLELCTHLKLEAEVCEVGMDIRKYKDQLVYLLHGGFSCIKLSHWCSTQSDMPTDSSQPRLEVTGDCDAGLMICSFGKAPSNKLHALHLAVLKIRCMIHFLIGTVAFTSLAYSKWHRHHSCSSWECREWCYDN